MSESDCDDYEDMPPVKRNLNKELARAENIFYCNGLPVDDARPPRAPTNHRDYPA